MLEMQGCPDYQKELFYRDCTAMLGVLTIGVLSCGPSCRAFCCDVLLIFCIVLGVPLLRLVRLIALAEAEKEALRLVFHIAFRCDITSRCH